VTVFEIVSVDGDIIGYVIAENERQALCIYLMKHEELDDMMLWKSCYNNAWRLAKYDNEDKYIFARKTYDF
jgi:hypothetical protein